MVDPFIVPTKIMAAVPAIIREAGRLICSCQDQQLQITEKSDRNYVTEIDLAVERLIVRKLKELAPDFAVITEEAAGNPFFSDRPTWILDPVDGTTNLMRGYRHSAISLALASEGQLRQGYIFNPWQNELFTAEDAGGARLNGRPIRSSQLSSLSDCLVGFGTTPYDRTDAHRTFLIAEQVFLRSLEIRRSGSAALDLAYVACGRLDGFFELKLQPWDYAAGALLIREAGGALTNWQGRDADLRHPDSVLATNGLIHRQMMDLLAAYGS